MEEEEFFCDGDMTWNFDCCCTGMFFWSCVFDSSLLIWDCNCGVDCVDWICCDFAACGGVCFELTLEKLVSICFGIWEVVEETVFVLQNHNLWDTKICLMSTKEISSKKRKKKIGMYWFGSASEENPKPNVSKFQNKKTNVRNSF